MTGHFDPWTPAEDARLQQLWCVQRMAKEQIAEIMPGRTYAAIAKRTLKLGLEYQGRTDKWTAEQDALLTRLWVDERKPGGQIAAVMPGYTRSAIIGRAHRLGLKRSLTNAEARDRNPRVAKPRVERKAPVRQGMIRFGGGSIPKSVIPEKPLAAERPTANPVTLEELRADQCGWPVNDGNPYLYCGAFRYRHKRYCDRHARVGVGRGRAA